MSWGEAQASKTARALARIAGSWTSKSSGNMNGVPMNACNFNYNNSQLRVENANAVRRSNSVAHGKIPFTMRGISARRLALRRSKDQRAEGNRACTSFAQ